MLLDIGSDLIIPVSFLLKSSPSLVMTRFLKIGFKVFSDVPLLAINILMELVPISMDATVFIFFTSEFLQFIQISGKSRLPIPSQSRDGEGGPLLSRIAG
jgi:hypothetical protein